MRTGPLLWTTSAVLAVISLAGCGSNATAPTPEGRLDRVGAAGSAGTSAPTSTSAASPTLTGNPDVATMRATATKKPSPARTTSTKAATRPAAPTPARPSAPGDIVWIRTPVLTHDKDFRDLTPYLNPAVPRDWVSPVNYRDGDITIRIEIVGAHDPAAVPIYYLVGWTAGAGQGYIRGGEMFTKASGVLEDRVPVKEWQRVVNGVDAGNVGDDWDWRHAFGQVNGDTWAANRGGQLYPLKVRVTVTLHPAAS